jgi:hypothetical protein
VGSRKARCQLARGVGGGLGVGRSVGTRTQEPKRVGSGSSVGRTLKRHRVGITSGCSGRSCIKCQGTCGITPPLNRGVIRTTKDPPGPRLAKRHVDACCNTSECVGSDLRRSSSVRVSNGRTQRQSGCRIARAVDVDGAGRGFPRCGLRVAQTLHQAQAKRMTHVPRKSVRLSRKDPLGERQREHVVGWSQAYNKQLQRTVTRRCGRGACASLHSAHAPRFTRQRAAAELRRYATSLGAARRLRNVVFVLA